MAMRWAVLVGGAGTNLKALLDTGFPVALVVSHRRTAGALGIAAQYGVPAVVLTAQEVGGDRDAYDRRLLDVLESQGIEAVALAGFLRWLTPALVDRYRGRLVNLHPSLLPAFTGLHAIERAYEAGVLWTGVSVHFVDEGQDSGPLIAQVPVPRYPTDTVDDLAMRVHQVEHSLYPRVIWALDQGFIEWHPTRGVLWQEEVKTWIHGL
ncbi:formyltetrahydrofolate-dependent phosphoribosylglycinamide formyltransferase [Sulfobacillus acidophilus DSM 10332]|uniref:Phosphoribosylglycinamide formyltransferase n=1 Tax=Sulfobacillus acidophilus (strain ATCC 700253 / DSM 10332 / NAL) TaxID=679936 RepID=G8TXC9_SULAD|nr:formyltetrahydrofolate-dependent phosphoribosylglycinamide formyltransferase [Sulfobacillus acidophilus DSM 10332]